MTRNKQRGGIIIELVWTIIFAFLFILLLALKVDWYYVLGAFLFFVWCLRGFIREIKDKDVENSKSDRMKIEDEIKSNQNKG